MQKTGLVMEVTVKSGMMKVGDVNRYPLILIRDVIIRYYYLVTNNGITRTNV